MMLIAQRYKIQSELGAGGMGTVYKGTDTQTGDAVAVKQLKPELVDASIIERFRREGEALRELNHPNIVKMLDAIEEQGNHYLIMDYISGGDLKDFIQQSGKLNHQKCVNMAIDLADALTRAHRLDIIHRDLKPANVLIGDDGVLRLTDFGVAHVGSKQRVTDTDAIVGTVDYLAPETLNGSEADPRSDIWSFGVMLFEMLTGKAPFSGQTISQTLTAILTESPPDLEELCPESPIALIDLVYRMLEKDPAARIRSVRYVGAELEDIMQGVGTHGSASADKHLQESTRFATPTPVSYAPKHNLPAQTTPFVGREHELTELAKLIDDPNIRLITILAPGGMGKSRLSLAIGERYVERYPDGVFFVELAPLSSIENIPSAIATATSYQFIENMGPPRDQILNYLANKNLLLIMDNYEHLLDGADLVSDILQAAPDVKILATSRERLNLTGEQLFALSGMDFPDWETPEDALDYAAVKLFMQSAKRIRPDFELQADDLTYLARICRMVAGMPLAIVLAATWVESLELEEIAEELADGLDILESELRDIPERQRSIQAVFDYSWNRLDDKEKSVFAKTSVFRGGMTRKAAQAVTGAKLRQLQSLVNKGLLRRDNDFGRYHIHELARQYAEIKLDEMGETEPTRNAHMNYYADFMVLCEGRLKKGPEQIAALNDIETEFDNVQVAWQRAASQQNFDATDRCIFSLARYCSVRNHVAEGLKLFDMARRHLAPPDGVEPHPVYGKVLLPYSLLLPYLMNNANPQEQCETALAIAKKHNDLGEISNSLFTLGQIGFFIENDPANGIRLMEEGITMMRDLNEPFRLSEFFHDAAIPYYMSGNFSQAVSYAQKALSLLRSIDDKLMLPHVLNILSTTVHVNQGDFDTAEQILDEICSIFGEMGDRANYAFNSMYRELIYLFMGRIDSTQKTIQLGLTTGKELNFTQLIGMAQGLESLLACISSDYELAWNTGTEGLANVKGIPDEGLFNWFVAMAACGRKQFEQATPYSLKFIEYTIQRNLIMQMVTSVFIPSLIFADRGQYMRATELASLTYNHHTSPTKFWDILPLYSKLKNNLKAELGEDAYNGAWERGKQLDLETVVKELLAEFGEEQA